MMTLFILKKLVSRIFFPLSLVIELLLLGIFWKKKRVQIIVAAVVLLYLFSFSPFGYLILRPLESRYAPVTSVNLDKKVKWIVVLGGGSRDDQWLTPEDGLENASLKRVLEGVRLSRLLPQSRLVFSGGDYRGIAPEAVLMQQVALDLGVPRERILLETSSWDTVDQAKFLKGRLGQAPFYLVTSARHMPRAVRLFVRAGGRSMAAPTDFHAVWTAPLEVRDFIPSTDALANTENAFYEYLGLAWDWIISTFPPRI